MPDARHKLGEQRGAGRSAGPHRSVPGNQALAGRRRLNNSIALNLQENRQT